MRRHPILKIKRMHNGLDFIAYYNTPVYAPGGGIVEYVGRRGGFGKMVVINHGFGYKTRYAHLNKYKVKKGQKVKRGDLIALSGNSGLSTGPHLHYEIRHNGIALNPRNFIFDDIKIFEFAQNLNKE
jgi:murein DD-endopeptidase MepM/ murein hydrolase activator NlpD